MKKTLLLLVAVAMVLVIAGCEENNVYTSPSVNSNFKAAPAVHYHPVYPYYGSDRSLYVNAENYGR